MNGVHVHDVKSFSSVAKKANIDIAIIAVPGVKAQPVLDRIMKAGVRAVLNVAPVPLKAEGDVKVKTVDLTISLESLSYFLSGDPGSNECGVKPKSPNSRKK